MSLVQQGTQTARNKNKAITNTVIKPTSVPKAMLMWNRDAQVLSNTCPAWGNFVSCRQQAKAIPANANGFTSHHFSINPR